MTRVLAVLLLAISVGFGTQPPSHAPKGKDVKFKTKLLAKPITSSETRLFAKDVGVHAILAPNGIVSPGSITPKARIRNYGATLADSFDVRFRIDATYSSIRKVYALAVGDSTDVSFDYWSAGQVGVYEARCTTLLSGDEDSTNNASIVLAGIATFVLDFESTDEGFVAQPDSDAWTLGMPTGPRPGAHSGTKAWGAPLADSYPNFARWTVTSPAYVALQNNPVAAFWHWYDFESDYDGGNLTYSRDGGSTWYVVYPRTYSLPYDGRVEALGNDYGFSRRDTTWRLVWFRIAVSAGTAFHLRWNLASDISGRCLGWMIDDIAGIGFERTAHDVGASAIIAPYGIISPGNFSPSARVKNYGTDTSGPFDVSLAIAGGYADTKSVTTLAPGESLDVAFPSWTVADPDVYYLTCRTALSGDQDPNSDTRLGITAIPDLLEDFDTTNGGFTPDPGSNAWTWGSPTSPRPLPHSGSKVWGAPLADSYPDFADWTLTSPEYYTVQSDPMVAFWHWYDFEPGFDGGNLSFSANGGRTWYVLSPWQPYSAPYDAYVEELGDGYSYFGRAWRLAWFRVPVQPQSEFMLRWRVVSDGTNRYLGWMIDDVAIAGLGQRAGWSERPSLPAGRKNKKVKDGGCLAFREEETGKYIYGLKGNNTPEFYEYGIYEHSWITKETIPGVGRSGRKKGVKRGATLCATEDKFYATKGNNTFEFWAYDPSSVIKWSSDQVASGLSLDHSAFRPLGYSTAAYAWQQLADVPTGAKTVKEGAGAVAVIDLDTAYVYFLKGSGTCEFYRYNTMTNTWQTKVNAPFGISGKPFKKGSCLAYDPRRNLIYALKGSYNEFYAYSVGTDAWITLSPLPLVGRSGKKKKAKDGAGIACLSDYIYALKGGNTLEFWAYGTWSGAQGQGSQHSASDSYSWTQLDDFPLGGGKNVKGGGALAATEDALFALKGNNTREFYSYWPFALRFTPNASGSNPTAVARIARIGLLHINPNPFAKGTTISYTVPKPGNVSLKLYDVTGTLVTTLASGYHNAGTSSFIVPRSSLSSGIYMLKLESAGFTTTSKVIIE
jgi:hypothetical protein